MVFGLFSGNLDRSTVSFASSAIGESRRDASEVAGPGLPVPVYGMDADLFECI